MKQLTKLLCAVLLFCLNSNEGLGQETQDSASGMIMVRKDAKNRLIFGRDSGKLYAFMRPYECFEFYADSTFHFFYQRGSDSGFLCVRGNWRLAKQGHLLIFILSETKRSSACGVVKDLKYPATKPFNDSFIYANSSKDMWLASGRFREQRYHIISPVQAFAQQKILRYEGNAWYFGDGPDGPAVKYIEDKYNIKFDFGTSGWQAWWDDRFFGKGRDDIFRDWQRASVSYNYWLYKRNKTVCSCYNVEY